MPEGRRSLRHVFVQCGTTLLATVAAFALRTLLAGLGPGVPRYVTFYPVVLLVTLSSGFGAGVVATVLGALLSSYVVVREAGSLSTVHPGEVVGLVLFVVVALFLAAGSEWHRRTKAQAAGLERQHIIDQSNRALRDAEARLREEARAKVEWEKAIFQAVVNGARVSHLAYLDRDFSFVRVNETYASRSGFTAEELVGKNHFDIYPDPENLAIFVRVRDTGEAVEFRDKPFIFPNRPDLGVTYWDWSLLPVRNAGGGVDGLVLALVETTQRKRVEQALIEADRRKNEFLATLSHELRNPLAPIQFALDILDRDQEPEARRRARAAIARQLRHLVRLVDDLLDVTRIANNKLQLRKRPVELADVVQEGIEAAMPAIERGGHRLDVPPFPENVWMDGDPDRLAQVLANLLNNAAKFTAPGGRITLSAGADAGEVTIAVADNGIGLAAGDLARVFDMFAQVGESRQAGLGIGLALVRGTVEQHGGRVEVQSDGPGLGSRFTVHLPRSAAPVAVAGPPAQVAPSVSRRVLVVDDNADSADMMRTLLELDGHTVQVAYDAESALRTASEFGPEIGFFDLGLPTMDGFELARRIREDPVTRGTCLVAVTGWGQEDDRRRARDSGFDAHVTKPANPDTIRRLVAALAEGHEQRV